MSRRGGQMRPDGAPPAATGDLVTIEGMPSYGALLVIGQKWSNVSGWWIEVRNAANDVWAALGEAVTKVGATSAGEDELSEDDEAAWRDEQQAEYDEQNPTPLDVMEIER